MYYTSNMQFNKLADKKTLDKTVKSLNDKGYEATIVKNKEDALIEVKKSIPEGATLMNGASVTSEQIGFVDYLKTDKHKWNNLHKKIVSETDPIKKAKLRKHGLLSDYYLGSVHALTQSGEFLVASNTASQLSHIVYSSENLIFIVSTKKIVPNLESAMKRLEKHIVPLEDQHMKEKYGMGTSLNKIVIFKNESPMNARKIKFILIEEDLGF